METYRIVRFYAHGKRRTIATGQTFEDCRRHCSNPDTSSRTATSAYGRRLTRRYGVWHDGFESEV